MSTHAKHSSAELSGYEQPAPLPIRTGGAPPIPPPRSPDVKRTSSYFSNVEPSSATSEKRMSRMPPPVPGSPIGSPRPPPPPPPTAAPPSSAGAAPPVPSALAGDEKGESDYEGDYDTDIASGAPHKEALKSGGHAREPSLDDSTPGDEATTPPAIPQHTNTAPRAVPPPPPPTAQLKSRQSMDVPRGAPPPVPPPTTREDADYDPYNYSAPSSSSREPPPVPGAIPVSAPPIPPPEAEEPDQAEESSADEVPSRRKSVDRAQVPPVQGERAPPLPSAPAPAQRDVPAPPQHVAQAPPRSMPRQSLDVARAGSVRRSMDQARPSGEHGGQMAQDVDLATSTQWWTSAAPLPPGLQARNGVDILSESEESQKSRRGGRTTISKDIYILYPDYSQTVLGVSYDKSEPSDVSFEQRHEAPPGKMRQDQLEACWERFGKRIADAASKAGHAKGKDKGGAALGDGSAAALPLELMKGLQSEALMPVGNKAYGALVYANLANASTMQFDEIRPGDIVTLRNARFEGHHGAIKSKYKVDYGVWHVGVVEEWDGTRRSVRVWEQGREKKGGVRSEKLRLGDLRSGEVRCWRVVGRDWVGWSE